MSSNYLFQKQRRKIQFRMSSFVRPWPNTYFLIGVVAQRRLVFSLCVLWHSCWTDFSSVSPTSFQLQVHLCQCLLSIDCLLWSLLESFLPAESYHSQSTSHSQVQQKETQRTNENFTNKTKTYAPNKKRGQKTNKKKYLQYFVPRAKMSHYQWQCIVRGKVPGIKERNQHPRKPAHAARAVRYHS
jgi:hypothetical protein